MNSLLSRTTFYIFMVEEDQFSQQVDSMLQKSYLKDLEDMLLWRYRWRKIYYASTGIAKFLIIISSVISFASMSFDHVRYLAFIAGCSTTLSVACLQYASYCKKMSKERSESINQLLKEGTGSVSSLIKEGTGSVSSLIKEGTEPIPKEDQEESKV